MSWNDWIRQIHRWLAIAFTVAVIVNFVAYEQQIRALWISALLPLALLLLSGLYLFVLPYATKWRRGRHAAPEGATGQVAVRSHGPAVSTAD